MKNQNNLYINNKFGCLYTWDTTTDKRNITSGDGWRVPTNDDWEKVIENENFVKTLKENLGGHSWSGSFGTVAFSGFWWSATEYDSTNAWSRYLSYSLASVYRVDSNKAVGFSVRLVKDIGNIENKNYDNCYIGNNGKEYKTILISNQLWLAENLCETKFHNGDNIEFSNYKSDITYTEQEVIELLIKRCEEFSTSNKPFNALLLKQDLDWFDNNKKK